MYSLRGMNFTPNPLIRNLNLVAESNVRHDIAQARTEDSRREVCILPGEFAIPVALSDVSHRRDGFSKEAGGTLFSL